MTKPKTKLNGRAPTDADVNLGKALRAAREEAEVSQMAIGEVIGTTLQQIQKYEGGVNRITAIRLYAWCLALGLAPEFFLNDKLHVAVKIPKKGDPKRLRPIAKKNGEKRAAKEAETEKKALARKRKKQLKPRAPKDTTTAAAA